MTAEIDGIREMFDQSGFVNRAQAKTLLTEIDRLEGEVEGLTEDYNDSSDIWEEKCATLRRANERMVDKVEYWEAWKRDVADVTNKVLADEIRELEADRDRLKAERKDVAQWINREREIAANGANYGRLKAYESVPIRPTKAELEAFHEASEETS